MKVPPKTLAERRVELITRIAAQRGALAAEVEPWRRPLALADRGIAAMRFVKAHPVWILGSAVAPSSGRLGVWLRRGFVAWRLVRQLRGSRSAVRPIVG